MIDASRSFFCCSVRMTSDSSRQSTANPSPDVQTNADDSPPNSARSVLAEVQARRQQRRRKAPPAWFQTLVNRWKNSESIRPDLHELLLSYRHELISYTASAIVLCVLAALMAMWALPAEDRQYLFDLLATASEPANVKQEPLIVEASPDPKQIQRTSTNVAMQQLEAIEETATVANAKTDTFDEVQINIRPSFSDLKKLATIGEFGGRTEQGRQIALQEYGGNAASEQAVLNGLKWLSDIQQKDGGWDFQKQGAGARVGSLRKSRNAATSLALLCFLGAGHTHLKDGPHRMTVKKALTFLQKHSSTELAATDVRGDYEGNSGMYTQGLATICLTEASALEPRDKDLKKLAEGAVRFIERAQTSSHGGWRYKPESETGDTSVVGWMVMALYSGRSCGVRVSGRTLRQTRSFLRDVATDDSQAFYAYTPGQNRKTSTTAIGLLCRMYLGWGPDTEAIQKGVAFLSSVGPSKDNMYYNYYATQVLHHYGGEEWKAWNNVMRSQLIKRQISQGPAKGSWKPAGAHHQSGGQLYETALCVLTLEVYYRHLPLFQKLQSSEDDAINAGSLSGE